MKNEIVNINIGGTKFSCWKSILTRHESLFSKLYQHQEFNSFCDQEGNLFFDRSPKLFEFILNSLRQCQYKIEFPEDSTFPIQQLINEIQFYGLSKTLKIEIQTPSKPTTMEILKENISFSKIFIKNIQSQGFQEYLKQYRNQIEDFLIVSAITFFYIFLILKFFVMTGFMTTYKVFYPLHSIFFMLICLLLLDFKLGYQVAFMVGILLSIWFYSSFIFTKIFYFINEGVYWRWITIMTPLILLSFIPAGVFLYFILNDWFYKSKALFSIDSFLFTIPCCVIYSLIAISSYLDDGYIQSYWVAFTPLCVYLICGFFVYLAKKNTANLKDENLKEVAAFVGLFFVLFIVGNWFNWIPHWILFSPVDLVLWRGFYLLTFSIIF
jgi:hypothetical protein